MSDSVTIMPAGSRRECKNYAFGRPHEYDKETKNCFITIISEEPSPKGNKEPNGNIPIFDRRGYLNKTISDNS